MKILLWISFLALIFTIPAQGTLKGKDRFKKLVSEYVKASNQTHYYKTRTTKRQRTLAQLRKERYLARQQGRRLAIKDYSQDIQKFIQKEAKRLQKVEDRQTGKLNKLVEKYNRIKKLDRLSQDFLVYITAVIDIKNRDYDSAFATLKGLLEKKSPIVAVWPTYFEYFYQTAYLTGRTDYALWGLKVHRSKATKVEPHTLYIEAELLIRKKRLKQASEQLEKGIGFYKEKNCPVEPRYAQLLQELQSKNYSGIVYSMLASKKYWGHNPLIGASLKPAYMEDALIPKKKRYQYKPGSVTTSMVIDPTGLVTCTVATKSDPGVKILEINARRAVKKFLYYLDENDPQKGWIYNQTFVISFQ
ncbi:hypothetical protein QGN29_00385 [Temperatibacter marinus]|uniref:Uncharacterized protein n=1 Tax=Temperatibacter marinus TaxID=1456591 RepID=A0AA52EIA2_9PROT|nr:hypothetical protein [Temperatibacter marinus]WND02819.1 hypothetical protein QGN29_00385 [Temperatibacter marinus]